MPGQRAKPTEGPGLDNVIVSVTPDLEHSAVRECADAEGTLSPLPVNTSVLHSCQWFSEGSGKQCFRVCVRVCVHVHVHVCVCEREREKSKADVVN